MKRSKNHHKLISGDKPYIYRDVDPEDGDISWTAKGYGYWYSYKLLITVMENEASR